MPSTSGSSDRYSQARIARQEQVEAILESASEKKVVVAGPGTGKTHLFKEVLKGGGKTLTLSFINALVEDLSLELCGISEVRTLHGFARSELARRRKSEVNIFSRLPEVIAEDARVLLGEEIDFNEVFHERQDEHELLPFYKKRKDYYGGYYGLADIVYALALFYEEDPERIPTYEQIVVDEFQDFNSLEVSLIDLLASRSPMLLAGDDDQALYDFKRASTRFIRERYGDTHPEYAPFSLPYCSRSTRVIVAAANDIIGQASSEGLLKGRIPKRFEYFDEEEKDAVSEQHPRLFYHHAFATKIPWLIQKTLQELAELERNPFSVLIISPTRVQVRDLVRKLRSDGLLQIPSGGKKESKGYDLFDGLSLLLEDLKSNLGWRISASSLLTDDELSSVLEKSEKEPEKAFSALLSKGHRRQVKSILKSLRAISKGQPVDENNLTEVVKDLGIDLEALMHSAIQDRLFSRYGHRAPAAIRKVSITATTVQSSKGLSADYVFITHFDDTYFIKDNDKTNISDRDVCSFLVALTRARKKVIMISTREEDPTFLQWVKEERIERP